ncbi:MAG: hypothetical protein ACE5HE_04065 [Phycisphaerae bacterium]
MSQRTCSRQVLTSMGVVVLSGCAWVRPVELSPEISADRAKAAGMPTDTLDYFKEKYPPDSWRPASGASRVAVGPACLSREAFVQLTGDTPEEVQAQTETGTTRSVLTVRSGDSNLYFYIARTSREVQAIVVDQLVKHSSLKVVSIEEPEVNSLLEQKKTFEQLRHDGIRYYVDGTVKAEPDSQQATRVYLRFRDTLTKEVICSTSGTGSDLPSAARSAAVALARWVKRPDGSEQETGG